MTRRRPPKRDLRPDERALWQKVTDKVTPLSKPDIRPAGLDQSFDSLDQTVPAPLKSALKSSVSAYTPPPHTRNPVDRSSERKVRRGHLEIEGRIDLHGMTSAKARASLLRYLSRAYQDRKRVVLVITGKGAGKRAVDERQFEPWSQDITPLPGVLRRSFSDWMRDPDFAQIVSGYSAAHQRHGGSGAFYVMLRA